MGARLLSWVDADGMEMPWNGETNYLAMIGARNLWMPPVELVTQDIPLRAGTTIKYVQIHAGNPAIMLHVEADSEAQLDSARRALIDAVDPERGPGILRHTANDNVVRELECVYQGGLEGDESDVARGPGWFDALVQFLAEDPFWHDPSFASRTFSVGAPKKFFDAPFLPLKLASSGLADSFSVDNTGNALAWPIWTINGPMTEAVLTNETTGDVLTVTSTLTSGQSLVIDTRPGEKTCIRGDTGDNAWDAVDPLSSLFPFVRRLNNIAVSLTGGDSNNTSILLQYKLGYKSV